MKRDPLIVRFCEEEAIHREVYKRLADRESDPWHKEILLRLHKIESEHVSIYSRVSGIKNIEVNWLIVRIIVMLKSIIGTELVIKIMENRESRMESEIEEHMDLYGKEVKAAIKSEHEEEMIKAKVLSFSPILSNIRDVVFGMNDGLVEIVAAVSGIGAALQTPILVIVAGMIVAISGTLSMAGGAYLSTDYQNTIEKSRDKNYKYMSPIKSAAYVGISYIIGAMFPLMPFIFGIGGYHGIAISIMLTALVLVFSSALISIIGNKPVIKRIVTTLLITFGIAAITILLGYYARIHFHIAI
jgi:VIT1/CCC1 family predicted Fe2+/Mn2+ transporter